MSEPKRYPEGLSEREKHVFNAGYKQGLLDAAFDIKENGFSVGHLAHNDDVYFMYDGVAWRQLCSLKGRIQTNDGETLPPGKYFIDARLYAYMQVEGEDKLKRILSSFYLNIEEEREEDNQQFKKGTPVMIDFVPKVRIAQAWEEPDAISRGDDWFVVDKPLTPKFSLAGLNLDGSGMIATTNPPPVEDADVACGEYTRRILRKK